MVREFNFPHPLLKVYLFKKFINVLITAFVLDESIGISSGKLYCPSRTSCVKKFIFSAFQSFLTVSNSFKASSHPLAAIASISGYYFLLLRNLDHFISMVVRLYINKYIIFIKFIFNYTNGNLHLHLLH